MSDELTQAIAGAMTEAGLSTSGDDAGDGSPDPGTGTDTDLGDGNDGDPDDALDEGDGTTDEGDDPSDDAGDGDTGADDGDPDASASKDDTDSKDQGDGEAVTSDSKPTGKDKKKGPIPFSRHEEVLKNLRDEYEHPEKGKLTLATKRVKELEWADSREAKAIFNAFNLADTDQKGFIRLLLKDRRFADIVQIRGEGGDAPIATRNDRKAVGEKPGPNAVYKDPESGKEVAYYDDKGLAALTDWQIAKAEETAQAAADQVRQELRDEYEKKYGPITRDHEARQLWDSQVLEERKAINYAEDHWPHFKEFKEQIKEAVFKDGSLTLFAAYLGTVIPALEGRAKVNEEAMRKKVLAQINKKRKAAQPPTNRFPQPKAEEREANVSAGDDEIMSAMRHAVRTKLRS